MGESTGIAWARSSWSPWIGCTKVSPGCDHCYAEALDNRHRYGKAVHWGPGVPRYRTKNWDAPLSWNRKAARTGEPWTVFPSLCDPFDNEVPEMWFEDLRRLISETPALSWLLLTKRVGNVEKMFRGVVYPNVWIGASIVNQEEADRDVAKLCATRAARRFISYEPALGRVDLRNLRTGGLNEKIGLPDGHQYFNALHPKLRNRIDWGICGGESNQGGAKARPFCLPWGEFFLRQLEEAGVPAFMKQLGSNPIRSEDPRDRLSIRDRAGADLAEWPGYLQVQKFPIDIDPTYKGFVAEGVDS